MLLFPFPGDQRASGSRLTAWSVASTLAASPLLAGSSSAAGEEHRGRLSSSPRGPCYVTTHIYTHVSFVNARGQRDRGSRYEAGVSRGGKGFSKRVSRRHYFKETTDRVRSVLDTHQSQLALFCFAAAADALDALPLCATSQSGVSVSR